MRQANRFAALRKRANGKVIRVYNQAARTAIDSNDLVQLKSGPNNFISGTLMLALVGVFPAVLAYAAVATFLRENIFGRDPRSFDIGAHFLYVAILLLAICVWLMTKLIARSQAKAKALSDVVDEAVRAQG